MRPCWRSAGTWQAVLLVAEERMVGLGCAAAMATAMATTREEEKNLIYYTRDFQTIGSPYGSFGVLFPRGWYIFIGRKTPHIYIT